MAETSTSAESAVPDISAITNTAGLEGGNSITLYRGIDYDRALEKEVAIETHYIMSDTALDAYKTARDAGQSVDEAVQSARAASEVSGSVLNSPKGSV